MNDISLNILHIKIGTINNWNCMKYHDALIAATNGMYDVKFTNNNVVIGTDNRIVVVIEIPDDKDSTMESLLKKVAKLGGNNGTITI